MDFLSSLPFEWAQFAFMRNAFIAVLLFSPLFGMLSTMVDSRMAFFSIPWRLGAYRHCDRCASWYQSALMVHDSLRYSFRVPAGKLQLMGQPQQIQLGPLPLTAIAAGIMILSLNGGFSKYSSFLIGDILSITTVDILTLAIVLVVVIVYWAVMYNSMMVVGINTAFASSRGIKHLLVEISFACVVALVVMASIQWVVVTIYDRQVHRTRDRLCQVHQEANHPDRWAGARSADGSARRRRHRDQDSATCAS